MLVAVSGKQEKPRVVFHDGGAVVNTMASSFPINAGSVRDVQSEPISGHPGYHIVTILLRDSRANSKYFLYWVPAQYLNSAFSECKANTNGEGLFLLDIHLATGSGGCVCGKHNGRRGNITF